MNNDDIVKQSRHIAQIHEGRSGHECISDAVDQIERLRKRNNYLREELNATDYRKREQAEEIMELRNRIAQLEQALDGLGYFKAITAIMDQTK
jgi:uncharacterized coiled-coil DUF342 family protein